MPEAFYHTKLVKNLQNIPGTFYSRKLIMIFTLALTLLNMPETFCHTQHKINKTFLELFIPEKTRIYFKNVPKISIN
jgi:hypothetical protein